jgi:hypothetical protein
LAKAAKRKTKTGVQNAVYGVERERICMRLQASIVNDVRRRAKAENRSFTNMVEVLLGRRNKGNDAVGVFD